MPGYANRLLGFGTYAAQHTFKMMVTRADWTRRYKAELKRRRPGLSDAEIDGLSGDEVFADSGDRYPDAPERAIDAELDDWDKEDTSRLSS